jgi:predicted nuclease of predicted toxin-antitoxin system
MAQFLANENVPADAILSLRTAGIDITWVREISPGITDPDVLAISLAENRVLVTFDKDFGELAFHSGLAASVGIVLLRPRLRSPQFLAQFAVATLSQPITWMGHFCVAQESRIRVVPLPS